MSYVRGGIVTQDGFAGRQKVSVGGKIAYGDGWFLIGKRNGSNFLLLAKFTQFLLQRQSIAVQKRGGTFHFLDIRIVVKLLRDYFFRLFLLGGLTVMVYSSVTYPTKPLNKRERGSIAKGKLGPNVVFPPKNVFTYPPCVRAILRNLVWSISLNLLSSLLNFNSRLNMP